jgi:hypothetical protein
VPSQPEIANPHPETIRRFQAFLQNLRASRLDLGLSPDGVGHAAGISAIPPHDTPWSPEDYEYLAQLGDRVRAARSGRGLSLDQMAARVGLHPDILLRIEGGVQDVHVVTILEFERLLDHRLV